jgi:dTDP-4-amino-4,6-dideoxygalactose transaminase
MLVAHEEEKVEKARFWSTQSRDVARHYQHSEIGYNYRMSNVVAGIGRGQLKVLNQRVDKKRYIHDFYKRELSIIENIQFMPENEWNEPNFWLTAILVDGINPNSLMDELEKENIESRPIWKPMHLQPIFEQYDYIGENVSEELFKKGICLPSDSKMTDEDLNRVVTAIKRVFNYGKK